MSLWEALVLATRLLWEGDPRVWGAAWVSVYVAVSATACAMVFGTPLGFLLARRRGRGQRAIETVLKTLTALPTVVVGLTVYTLLSRSGPLGFLGLLYTPGAMIVGETLLVTPLVAALTFSLVRTADPRIEETALTLGATRLRAAWTLVQELRAGFAMVVATAFGRLLSELGVALMVGGNILGATRTLTTAIALETSKGEFALAFALGMLLLCAALLVNAAVAWWSPPARLP
jgi:tungstate transport system permease protein